MTSALFHEAYEPFAADLAHLLGRGVSVIDAHAHLGSDEDGHSLNLERLIGLLDDIGPNARACVFPLHAPDRHPAFRRPNDNVLEWARESAGRLIPYCRLDPSEDPVREAERCLDRGARGIKLHPRAQRFSFADPVAEAIFAVARDAAVPILIHAGGGMPTMAPLVDLALRFPDVTLVLAHGAIADQGMFATRLAEHPAILYDTACYSPLDVVELFARVPAERIVFASDAPYGHPATGLYVALRAATHALLDRDECALVAGGTMTALLDGDALPPARQPRLASTRPFNGRLLRISHYLQMALAAALSTAPFDPSRMLPWIKLAQPACRDPEPGSIAPALERIGNALDSLSQLISAGCPERFAVGLLMAACAVAATEPLLETAPLGL